MLRLAISLSTTAMILALALNAFNAVRGPVVWSRLLGTATVGYMTYMLGKQDERHRWEKLIDFDGEDDREDR